MEDRRDVVVVGAGMAGLCALHHLRAAGFTAVALERGAGLGGTWFWNRYPGARCDVPSLEYSFGFDDELQQEWEWTEVFPGQPELLRYLEHVADRFDLRRDIRLGVTVESAVFDEDAATWTVTTASGDRWVAPFVVMATGCLSQPLEADFEGMEDFAGTVLRTSEWPEGDVDLSGRRVGVIGTGSSGIQVVPELARQAAELVVFQRTPTYTWPSFNGPLDPEVQAETKRNYAELRRQQREIPGGTTSRTGAIILQMAEDRAIAGSTPAEREEVLERLGWGASRAWTDTVRDRDANEMACDLYREMVRRTVNDAELAERLSPRNLPIGCKRPVIDAGWYDTFNLPHVSLVSLRSEPILRFETDGIRTSERFIPLDVVVLAIGFDAMTGALDRIDIRGRGDRVLREEWRDGPRTYLGLQVEGFPNLFTVTGPGSPSVLSNMIVGIEHHIEWIVGCLIELRRRGATTIEPSVAAQEAWVEHVRSVAQGTMFVDQSCNSWYLGVNVPGKPRVFLPYVGGFDRYVREVSRIVEDDYEGFLVD